MTRKPPQKDGIFLTCAEAVESVRADFRQYDPQIPLFCEILRLINGDHASVLTDRQKKDGAWVRLPGQRNMCWMTGRDLCDHLCDILDKLNPEPTHIPCNR